MTNASITAGASPSRPATLITLMAYFITSATAAHRSPPRPAAPPPPYTKASLPFPCPRPSFRCSGFSFLHKTHSKLISFYPTSDSPSLFSSVSPFIFCNLKTHISPHLSSTQHLFNSHPPPILPQQLFVLLPLSLHHVKRLTYSSPTPSLTRLTFLCTHRLHHNQLHVFPHPIRPHLISPPLLPLR